MTRHAPPLEAVEAFIVAAHSESFRLAAEKLSLSPSAFSRRIQTLEGFLRVPLFDRDSRAVTLTAMGEQYLRTIEPAVNAIRRATVDLRADRVSGPIRIMTPQSFAIGWLLPRLPAYQRQSADAKPPVELTIGRDLRELGRGLADIAVVVAAAPLQGWECEELVEIDGIAVCAPVMADGRPPPARLEDLHRYPILQVFKPEGIWDTWLKNEGYDGPPLHKPIQFGSAILMYEAAAAGMGVALAAPLLVDRLLKEGRLQRCIRGRVSLNVKYFLIYADESVRRRPAVRRLVSWIHTEINRSTAQIAAKDETSHSPAETVARDLSPIGS